MDRMRTTQDIVISNDDSGNLPTTLFNVDSELEKVKLEEKGNLATVLLDVCWHQVDELRLDDCGLEAKDVKVLASVIKQSPIRLKVLDLGYNNIGNIGMKELASCVENIQKLWLGSCGITEVDDLCAKIRTLQQPLKVLDLGFNEIGNIGMKELASCVENIQELRWWNCDITKVDDLCAKIRTLQQPLKVLDLRGNKIGNIGMKELASCVENIQELRLDDCDITEVDDLCAKIRTLQEPLNGLDLSHNKIGSKGASSVALCIRNIKSLKLENCCIGELDEIATVVARLQEPVELIDLRGNVLGKSAMASLASFRHNVGKVLMSSYRISMDRMQRTEDIVISNDDSGKLPTTLFNVDSELEKVGLYVKGNLATVVLDVCWHQVDELRLQRCRLQAKDVKVLASVIKQSPIRLNVLDLGVNKIGNIGMKELASCVENIQELRLFDCDITKVDDLCAKIRTLQQPLKVLQLSRNKIGNIGMKELASCVENIQELRLRSCDITEVDDLFAKIRTLQQPLKVLHFSDNKIGNIGMKELASCVENIQELRLFDCDITKFYVLFAKIRTLQQPV